MPRKGQFSRDLRTNVPELEVNISNWFFSGSADNSARSCTLLNPTKTHGFAAGANGTVTASYNAGLGVFEIPLNGGVPSNTPVFASVETVPVVPGTYNPNVQLRVHSYDVASRTYPHVKVGFFSGSIATGNAPSGSFTGNFGANFCTGSLALFLKQGNAR